MRGRTQLARGPVARPAGPPATGILAPLRLEGKPLGEGVRG